MSSERGPRSLALAAVLALGTLGRGGDVPEVMFLVHAAVAAMVAREWLRPATSAPHAPDPAPLVAFAAFAVSALSGAAVAPYGYSAFLVVQEWAVALGLLWVASRAGPEVLPSLSAWMLAVAACQGSWMLVQKLVLGTFRPAGTMLNPNHLAAWLAAALLLAAGSRRSSRMPRALMAALAAPALAAFLLVGSRGAYLGAVAGTAVLVLPAWPRWSRSARRAALAAAIAAVLLAAGVLVWRFRSPDPFPYQRARIWSASLRVLEDDPWTGTGPGQFRWISRGLQFPDTIGPLRFDRTFSTTHSDVVRLAVEYGAIGGVLFLVALALVLRRVARMTHEHRRECRGALAALAALGVHALVENLSHRPAVYLLAAVLLGVVLARDRLVRVPGSRIVRVGAGLALVVALLAGDAAPLVSWRLLAGTPERAPLAERERERLRHAVAWNPVQPYAWAREAEARWAEDPGLEGYRRAREAAEEAVRRNPLDPDLRLRLARLEAAACRGLFRDVESRSRAAERYGEAERLAPTRITLALEKAEFLLGTSDPRGAERAARRAMALEPEAVPPRLLLARILLERGEDGRIEAARLLREARESYVRHADAPRDDAYTRRMLEWPERPVRDLRERLERRAVDAP